MLHNYPIILIPKVIQDIENTTIYPKKAPLKPKPLETFEPSHVGWYFLLFALLSAVAVPLLGILVCCIGIILIHNNNNKKKEYLQKTQLFTTALQEYKIKNNIYKAAKKDSFALKVFQENELKQLLAATAAAKITFESPKGKSEKDFHITLNKYFEGFIFTNKGIEFFNNTRAYIPDFIFIHKKSNLHIDIEIDEPYVGDTGQPIHYCEYQDNIYTTIDHVRNLYFMEKGWCIIRFAEEQVIKYPIECCKVIAEVIYDITEDNTYINRFNVKNDLPSVKHWTKTEAIAMYQKDFRNQYYANKFNK